MSLDDLLAAIEEDIGESEREAAKMIANDLAGLLAQKAAGHDIESELAHIKAQTANLTATTAQKVATTFREWATNIVGTVIAAAL